MAYNAEERNFAVFGTEIINGVVQFTNASATDAFPAVANAQTIITAAGEGTLIDSIRALSDDSVNRNINLYIKDGGTIIPIGTFTVPLNAGTNGTVLPLDVLSHTAASHHAINNQGKRYLRLKPGQLLIASIPVAPSATKNIFVIASGLTIPS
jgi:hypothetical protein